MKPASFPLYLAALALAAAACSNSGTTPTTNSSGVNVSNAFSSLPPGFADVQSTFGDSTGSDWTPGDSTSGHHDGDGHGGGFGGGGLMCGGLGGFDLGLGFGGRDLLGGDTSNCAYDASTGRVACAPETRDGLTVTRSVAYSDASGNAQQAFDSTTTNAINTQVQVSGTRQGRSGDTSTVQHSSERTVTGLAAGSSQRTVDGMSAGQETIDGSDSTGTYQAVRVLGDTIQGVVVPVSSDSSASYPTAGSIIRSMAVTVTYQGQSPTSSARHEVVTFDGSNTAKVVITQDGTTQSCTLALPGRQLSCS